MSPLDQTISDLGMHPLLRLALHEASLSRREAITLALSLQGFTKREIASQLSLSHTHIIRILKRISEKVVPKLPFPPIYM
jgi:DNA-binding CsgD family transcriptional regulator